MPEHRERQGNRIFGAVVGVVTNNQDPENRARVKVRYPWLDGTLESDWSRVATFYAGAGRGSYFMPEVGDEVLLMFQGGDPEKPYVFGSVWNGSDNVPGPGNPDGKNDDKWFESRSGHQLKLNDGASPSITLIDSSKNNSFHIDVNGDKITQKAATGDIYWSAPVGSINLQCVDLNVSVTGNATHKTDTAEQWTVGANQTVSIETSLETNVGASSTHQTPDAKIAYSAIELAAGVANWTVADLKATVAAATSTIGTLARMIGTERADLQKYGLFAKSITHTGGTVVESAKDALAIGAATVAWTGGLLALKGGYVGIVGTGAVNVTGGLIGLNPKIMAFPVAKLLDPVMSPFCEFHNVIPYTAPLPPVLPMIPHFSMGPILNGIAPSILVNGLPAAGVGADAIGFHIPLVGVMEIPTPPRCLGRIINTVFMTVLGAAMAAYSLHSVVADENITTANKVSAIVQTVIGLLIGFIPLPIMTGSIVLGAPSVAVNGQPPGLLLTPMGGYTCSEIPIIPNALPLGFSNVIAGMDFGELASQLWERAKKGLIMLAIKKGVGAASKKMFGDPVDAVDGTMYSEARDVDLPGPLPLWIDRHYSSLAATGIALGEGVYAEAPPSTLGPGWRHSFEEWAFDDGVELRLHTAEGFVKRLVRPADAEGARAFDPVESFDLVREADGGVTVRDKGGHFRRFAPRAGGDPWQRLVSVHDRNGNTIAVEHGHRGEPTWLRDSAGRVLRFVYGEDGLLDEIRLVHAAGRSDIDVHLAGYVHDGRRDLREAGDRSLVPRRYDYDELHHVVRYVDRTGHPFHFEYDALGRCARSYGEGNEYYGAIEFVGEGFTRVTDGYGNVTLYRTDEKRRVVAEVSPTGKTRRWEYDEHGRTTLEGEPDGGVWRFEHDARGNRVGVTRPDGTAAKYEYDAEDRLTAVVTPAGGRWTIERDEATRTTTYRSPGGVTWRTQEEARGLIERVEMKNGAVQRLRHDAAGNLVEVSWPTGAVERATYDPLGQLERFVDPTGATWEYGYDAGGRTAKVERPDGTAWRCEYDADGNVVRERDGQRNDVRYAWASNRRLVSRTDALGNVTRWEYGLYSDLRRAVLPGGGEIRLEHDADFNVVSMTAPEGRTESYEWDPCGRLACVRDDAGGERRMEYDALGRVVARRLPDGALRRYGYGPLGQLVSVSVQGPHDDAAREEATYQYDADGRLVLQTERGEIRRFQYDPSGFRSRVTGQDGLELAYERDPLGRVGAMRLPDGSEHRWERDAAGRVTRWLLPGGLAEHYEHDGVGRLSAQVLRSTSDVAPRALHERRWRYDAEGLVAEILDSRRGRRRFGYDPAGHLTAVDAEGGFGERFSWDGEGNLTGTTHATLDYVGQRLVALEEHARRRAPAAEREAEGGDRDRTHEYDRAGRLVRQRLEGDRVRRYEWDGDDRLVRVIHPDGGTTAYEYDAFGRRTAKVHDDGARTEYGWDGPLLLWERPGFAGEKTWYFGDGESFAPVVQVGPGGTYTHHRDHLGVPQELRDPSGAVAWRAGEQTAFGRVEPEPEARASTSHRLPGQYADPETGLHYNLNRYYDPDTGRYISPDPIGLAGGENFYAYVPDPVNWTDPLGLAGAGCVPSIPRGKRVSGDPLDQVPARYRASVQAAFDGQPVAIRLTEDMTVYRHWGGGSGMTGSPWYAPSTYVRPGNARRYLALPDANPANTVTRYTIPAGTTILVGRASSQTHSSWAGPHAVGGGQQIYVPDISAPTVAMGGGP